MIIRRATPADTDALAALAARSFAAKFGTLYPPDVLAEFLQQTYSTVQTRALIVNPLLAVWVAEQDTLLAYAVLGPCKLPHPDVTPGCLELQRLYTGPEATGRGLGTVMMEGIALPAFAAATGDAWLGVYSENPGALRFYARFGFVKVGEYEFPVGPIRDREFILRRSRR